MVKSLKDFRKQIKPEVQADARAKAAKLLVAMSLAEVRKVRGYSQVDLANHLVIAQSNISQMETRGDLLVTTLANYIRGLGGTLEIRAKFPDGQDIELKLNKRAPG